MSSLTAWNNFLKEGYEFLGDDFEDLTDYEQVRSSFAKLTEEIIPLFTVESGLYQFANGTTLKSWREKYVKDDSQMLGIGLDRTTIEILESDAMIMKDERAKYARFLHGIVRETIQEETVKFEYALFEEQEEPKHEEVNMSSKIERNEKQFAELTNLRSSLQNAGFSMSRIRTHLAWRFNLSHKWIDNVFMPHTKSKAYDTKEKIIREMKGMLRKTDRSHVVLNEEIDTLRKTLRGVYNRYSDLYEDLGRKIGLNVGYVAAICVDKTAGLQEKKIAIRDTMKNLLEEHTKPKDTNTETKTMKPQERTTQESINIFAKNLAKSVLNQLSVNDLNAEIADAFTEVTNLKVELANAESRLDAYKTVKDMMSKDELTENDILVLTSYVDSMSGN